VLNARELERWLFGTGRDRRRTQDSPIMPDVWYAYGAPSGLDEDELLEPPLVMPDRRAAANEETVDEPYYGKRLRPDLLLRPHSDASAGALAAAVAGRLRGTEAEAQLAYNDAYVACRLSFDQLLRNVLPLSAFWQKDLWPGKSGVLREHLEDRIEELAGYYQRPDVDRRQGANAVHEDEIPGNVCWLIGLVGRVAWEFDVVSNEAGPPPASGVVQEALGLLGDVKLGPQPEGPILWSVSRNRPVTAAVWRSRIAAKADAATRLFRLSCRDVRWAVIDSGIDARHPAFAKRHEQESITTDGNTPAQSASSRVAHTWNFAQIREALSVAGPDSAIANNEAGSELSLADSQTDEAATAEDWVKRGREIDWSAVAPQIVIPHDHTYTPPADGHGTHVAGILASDWRAEDLPTPGKHDVQGMCPDLVLYDLRAFDDTGRSDEFSILSAMQFVRYLNAHADRPEVHGVNLSFSVRHEVAKYAAGHTPVCEEAHRLVGSGVIVVAAAGNDGRGGYVVKGKVVEGYRTVSITDPGNAERVITVGATHRDRPHTYGVSYFSSRGPTGDGRAKPDLLAPGEKITAPVPDGGLQAKDGTSQAAPHVSGACALLLARHPELIGNPDRVKEILMETCTDLGREPAFQGAGMIDVLRAVQAV
jgi:hypothetical protein